jgi:nitroreductase
MASASQTVSLPDEATLLRAVESAVRAPSVYNSQPWRWRIDRTTGIDLFADRDRHLITIDAGGRDLLLSCGAALQFLVVALAGLGWSARVDRLPDPENSDHLARVQPVDPTPAADLARLAPSIALRRTDRRRFGVEPVDPHLLDTLVAATGLGLATTPLSQPLEVAATRDWITEHIVGPRVFPQLVIRVGWADPQASTLPPTLRRSVDRVVLRNP